MCDLSIILPTRNRADPLLKALMGIERATHCAYEVIVVDCGSADATSEVLLLAGSVLGARLRAVRESRPVGFAAACNRGVALARGRSVCVLTDDLHPADGALDRAVARLDAADARTILALPAPPDAELGVAVARERDGRRFAVGHLCGTLVAAHPFARRTLLGAMPFDEALSTRTAAVEFSLRAWNAGHRIEPAIDSPLDGHGVDASPGPPLDRAELNMIIAHWNLPPRTTAFDPHLPCTLPAPARRVA